MLYLTYSMIPSIDLARDGLLRAQDLCIRVGNVLQDVMCRVIKNKYSARNNSLILLMLNSVKTSRHTNI